MIDNTVHHITQEADALLDEVEILYRKFEYEAAEQILRNILSMLEHHLHRDDLGDALNEASLKHTIISHMSRVYNYFAAIADSRAEYANALHYAEIGISYCDQANNEIIKIRFLQLKGNVYKDITDNSRAIECFHQCIELCEKHNKLEILAYPLGSLGNMYSSFGDFTKAIEYYTRALAIDEKINHKEGIARNLGNMANLYGRLSIPTKAFEYLLRSLEINEEIGNKAGIAINLGNIGEFYLNTGDFHTALEYFNRALALSLEVSALRPAGFWMLGIATVELKLGNTEAALEGLNATLDFRRNVLHSNEGVTNTLLQLGILLREIGNPEESIMRLSEGIALAEELEEKTSIASLSEALAESYFALGDGMKAYELHKKFYELDSAVKSEETKKQADKFDTDRKQAESEKQIAVERARAQATDEILANILPASIVERLIKGEKKIADTHRSVSVLFVDIVGFTRISTQLPAGELISLLDLVFTRFDTICKKHGLEKIKTIGDAYMAVCGAPVAVENHAERAALAALEMLEDFSMEQRFSARIDLGFRIGLHSGSVVAGIIGENKYSYDLWGDAVNTASRMESHGEEDKIHVSEEFLKKLLMVENEWLMVNGEWLIDVSDNFAPFTINQLPLTINNLPLTIIPRGEMDIKGKGMMKTYFLENV